MNYFIMKYEFKYVDEITNEEKHLIKNVAIESIFKNGENNKAEGLILAFITEPLKTINEDGLKIGRKITKEDVNDINDLLNCDVVIKEDVLYQLHKVKVTGFVNK